MTAPPEPALPGHWRRGQRLKNNLIYRLVLLGVWLASVLPFGVLRVLGVSLAALGFVFDVPNRRRALRQLREALPEQPRPWLTVFRLYTGLGRLAAEWTKLDTLAAPDSSYVRFSEQARAVLDAALAEGRGVLFIAPHLGNWELLAQASARRGYPIYTTAKETYDPRITALVERFRERAGVRCLWRGDPAIMAKLGRAFAEQAIVGALIDQDTKVPSVWAPFFGKPAKTPVVPQLLAVRYGAPVVFGYAAREGAGYTVHFERVELDPGVPKTDAAQALTADLNRRIEAAVRRYPEQWVWMHARWKSPPPPATHPETGPETRPADASRVDAPRATKESR